MNVFNIYAVYRIIVYTLFYAGIRRFITLSAMLQMSNVECQKYIYIAHARKYLFLCIVRNVRET